MFFENIEESLYSLRYKRIMEVIEMGYVVVEKNLVDCLKEKLESLKAKYDVECTIDDLKTVLRIDIRIAARNDNIKGYSERFIDRLLFSRNYEELSKLYKEFSKLQDEIDEILEIYSNFTELKTRSKRKREQLVEQIINEIESAIIEFESKREKIFERIKELQSEQKKILKRMRELVSEYYRERKEQKKRDREALLQGRFGDVIEDKIIKEWLREEFGAKNITIIDKSTEHKAVLYAVISYDSYYSSLDCPWRVNGLYLAGIDDNEEAWNIEIGRSGEWLDELRIKTVEQAMKVVWLFNDFSKVYARQGDVLILKLNENENYKDVHDPYVFITNRNIDVVKEYNENEIEETKRYEILPSHTLESESEFRIQEITARMTVKEIEVFAEVVNEYTLFTTTQTLYVVEVNNPATLKHTSHRDVQLEQGRYLILTYPSIFRGD